MEIETGKEKRKKQRRTNKPFLYSSLRKLLHPFSSSILLLLGAGLRNFLEICLRTSHVEALSNFLHVLALEICSEENVPKWLLKLTSHAFYPLWSNKLLPSKPFMIAFDLYVYLSLENKIRIQFIYVSLERRIDYSEALDIISLTSLIYSCYPLLPAWYNRLLVQPAIARPHWVVCDENMKPTKNLTSIHQMSKHFVANWWITWWFVFDFQYVNGKRFFFLIVSS